MRRKLIILSIAYIAIYCVIFSQLFVQESEPVKPFQVEQKFTDFELALGKTFRDGFAVDGEVVLVEKVKKSEVQSSELRVIEDLSYQLYRHNKFPQKIEISLVETKFENTDEFEFMSRIQLQNGLEYEYSKQWTFGIKTENLLAWFESQDSEQKSFLSSESGEKQESKLLLTLKYSF